VVGFVWLVAYAGAASTGILWLLFALAFAALGVISVPILMLRRPVNFLLVALFLIPVVGQIAAIVFAVRAIARDWQRLGSIAALYIGPVLIPSFGPLPVAMSIRFAVAGALYYSVYSFLRSRGMSHSDIFLYTTALPLLVVVIAARAAGGSDSFGADDGADDGANEPSFLTPAEGLLVSEGGPEPALAWEGTPPPGSESPGDLRPVAPTHAWSTGSPAWEPPAPSLVGPHTWEAPAPPVEVGGVGTSGAATPAAAESLTMQGRVDAVTGEVHASFREPGEVRETELTSRTDTVTGHVHTDVRAPGEVLPTEVVSRPNAVTGEVHSKIQVPGEVLPAEATSRLDGVTGEVHTSVDVPGEVTRINVGARVDPATGVAHITVREPGDVIPTRITVHTDE
jgi:hypothetical protein